MTFTKLLNIGTPQHIHKLRHSYSITDQQLREQSWPKYIAVCNQQENDNL